MRRVEGRTYTKLSDQIGFNRDRLADEDCTLVFFGESVKNQIPDERDQAHERATMAARIYC